MARNDDEEEIRAQEKEARRVGYEVAEQLPMRGEEQLSGHFRWIAGHLAPETMSDKTPVERRRHRQEISKYIKEVSDVVREKHIQRNREFSCIDQFDECVRKRKRQKKSPYLCFLALYICLANSMKALLALAAKAGGHLS
ncbi:MAG TPA: hypothetical protein VKB89_29990 [Xanthobacteraceae bacterium]|nr:hypothetical protein [Xanthobacteraceae bacterium]